MTPLSYHSSNLPLITLKTMRLLVHISLQTFETNLEICFVEHILDVVIKRAPVGFLCIHLRSPVYSR